jgi:hypothetical protein
VLRLGTDAELQSPPEGRALARALLEKLAARLQAQVGRSA